MIITKNVDLETRGETDIIDITPDVDNILTKTKLKMELLIFSYPDQPAD